LRALGHVGHAHHAAHERGPGLLGDRLQLREIQNCRSFISISVTPWSSTQVRSMVNRDCSGLLNMLSGNAFRIDATPTNYQ